MMTAELILYSFFAGITIFVGGFCSFLFDKESPSENKQIIIHIITAFGGGILLSAVSLVLVPKGMEGLSLPMIILLFVSGAIAFASLDLFITKKAGSMGTLLAMLLDFIPESIALGATFAVDPKTSILLAVFIGLQNLPESFNSYLELKKSGLGKATILGLLFVLSFFGVISAYVGHVFLTHQPELTSGMMLFASSGIIFLVFKDIGPKINYKNYSYPSIAVSMGFMVGMIGEKVI
jgi:ZIP family zinc transporter